MQELKEIFISIDKLIESCNIDYRELKSKNIDENFFEDYSNQRLLNSFLFNFIKIQDKVGAKLFKKVLIELKEIDSQSVPMRDVLNILEKLEIIKSVDDWDRLREIRNSLTHEYPLNIEERVENIELTLNGYEILKNIYFLIKNYFIKRN